MHQDRTTNDLQRPARVTGTLSISRRTRGRFGIPVLVFAMFGMLFWTKLRLSVDVPKTAYAVPQASAVDPEARDAQLAGSDDQEHTNEPAGTLTRQQPLLGP